MKTCPLLWRQSEGPASGLLEKSVDLDGRGGPEARKAPGGGLHMECLGAACRFYDAGSCMIEKLARVVSGEEIAQGFQLATATLTDEIRTALDCTAGPLHRLEQRLGETPTGGGDDGAATAEVAQARAVLEGRLDDLAARLDGWRDELAARFDGWRDGATSQLGELGGTVAGATAEVGQGLRELRERLEAERVSREESARAAQEWRESVQRQLADTDERWENMLLSLTELTERLDSALDTVKEHIALERQERERGDRAAKLATARKENNAGVVFYHRGDLERAAEKFNRAVELAPDFVEAHNNLGLVETERGNAEAATKHFQRAIELDPSLSASYNNLGYVFFLQENYEEAIAMYQEAIERAANGSAAWTNLGNAHFKLGNLEKAREAWETAIELDPGNRKAAENLARLLQESPV